VGVETPYRVVHQTMRGSWPKWPKGVWMRKFLFAVILCFLPVMGFCKWTSDDFQIGHNQECFIDTYGNDAYWFCGKQTESCNSIKAAKNDKKVDMRHGDVLNETRLHNGETDIDKDDISWLNWVCCGGTDSAEGRFKAPSTSQRDKEVNGGTCKQTIDQCGDVTQDCSEPTDCPEGTQERIIKNNFTEAGVKHCAPVCPATQGYENETSNTCVPCETTLSQGVDGKGVCRKCDASTQFFRAPTANDDGGCKSLEDASNKYSTAQMQLCWKCANDSGMASTCFGHAQIGIKNALEYAKNTCLVTTDTGNDGQ